MPKKGIIIPKMGTRKAGHRGGIADALFTTTQQRVLGLIFGQPERSFYATQLIALTGSGSGAVQRELQRLTESDLVTVSRVGNQKHFQANRSSPVFEEMHSLVIKTTGLAEPIRQALRPLEGKIDVALLYGSAPKGTDTALSDIDLLVVSDELTLEELYAAVSSAETALDRRIHPTLYTAKEFNQRRDSRQAFVTRLLEGEHIVLLGEDHVTAAR